MKKNVILSAVAATVVTGALMLGGCGSNSKAPEYDAGKTAEGSTTVVMKNGKVTGSALAEGNSDANLGGGFSNTKIVVKDVRDCKDANNQPKPCENVCVGDNNPCEVKITTACSNDTGTVLDYTKTSDFTGAFSEFNNSGNADVVAVRNDATLVPAFSGVINVNTSKAIGSCGFDINTFVVCALTRDNVHAWNSNYESGGNSAGYVLVLAEYEGGHKEWKKVDIDWGDNDGKSGQPGVNVSFDGKTPAKITIMSVLKKGRAATGATGSTGATIL
jgi:hypothetical protein